MNIQHLIDGMNAKWMKERAKTQMTLGAMIAALKEMPEGSMVVRLDGPHSYRGYYSDLAFELDDSAKMLASDLVEIAQGCMGECFTGYKGGDFHMHSGTPVWVAYYGRCGDKLMGFDPDGFPVTEKDD